MRRLRPQVRDPLIVCRKKRQRRCPELVALREAALEEWCRAVTLGDVRAAWGRLGGLTTLHRHGREQFARMGRRSGAARRRPRRANPFGAA